VRLRYDASVREQWLAIDDLIDAVDAHASLEGDGLFESAPDNWVAVHFDHGTCGRSRTPS
jgi:arabinogalactan endo-1,4-beta-galactosidase